MVSSKFRASPFWPANQSNTACKVTVPLATPPAPVPTFKNVVIITNWKP